MSKITKGAKDNVLNQNGKPTLKAANKDGQAILDAILSGKKAPNVQLRYVDEQKCWVNKYERVTLFNIADDERNGFNLLKNYLEGKLEKEPEPTPRAKPVVEVEIPVDAEPEAPVKTTKK